MWAKNGAYLGSSRDEAHVNLADVEKWSVMLSNA